MNRSSPFLYIALALPLFLVIWLFWKLVHTHPPVSTQTVTQNAEGGKKAVQMFVFPGWVGPTNRTVVPPPQPAAWQQYSGGSHSRLAVLLTDTNSAWLGVTHGLETIGVPYRVTTDWREATQHRVVLVYPQISGELMRREALQAVAAHPQRGGTLLACAVTGGGLNEVFGFGEAVPSRSHYEVKFVSTNFLTAGFTEEREWTIRIANPRQPEATAGTYSYTQPRDSTVQFYSPLAVYDDGTTAITQRQFAAGGGAYAFGFDVGNLLLLGYNNREEGISRAYVNQFEPSLDVVLRLIKKIYEAGEPNAVTLGTVPFNRSLTVLMTHDIDFTSSLSNAVAYAALEKSVGIRATYFLQTKYVRDFEDEIFFHDRSLPFTQQLIRDGMEVASHTVCHSPVYAKFPLGDGTEHYPAYTPFVRDRKTTISGTVLGELRVSKFLIERATGHEVVSFRPGELSNPYALPQSLLACGYRYSSSVTANNSLTHLPFRLNYGRERTAETPVPEFPVTIEDEELPLLGERLPQALAVARQVSRYGGLFVILIHPNILNHKLDFERRFLVAAKDAAWFGTVAEFGAWWHARANVALDATTDGRSAIVTLDAPLRVRGLTLNGPVGHRLAATDPPQLRVTQYKDQIVLEEIQGKVRLQFTK